MPRRIFLGDFASECKTYSPPELGLPETMKYNTTSSIDDEFGDETRNVAAMEMFHITYQRSCFRFSSSRLVSWY